MLAHDRAGTGTPVLLLHGWPGDRTDYADVVPLLADAADVVVPDLRGFGGSERDPGGDHAMASQVRAVIELMDRLGSADAVIGGYDVGSRVTQQLAVDHPDRRSPPPRAGSTI